MGVGRGLTYSEALAPNELFSPVDAFLLTRLSRGSCIDASRH